MTRRRWIADEHSGDTAALTGSNAAHLARVLRARVGQQFDISLGDRIRRGTVTSVAETRVEFSLAEELPAASATPISLYLAVFKFDRFEWAIEKSTELGVARIVPVLARRTEPHLAASSAKRVERWRRIALEAAQQSRRLAPPEIAAPIKLKLALDESSPLRIVLAENEQQTTLRDLLTAHEEANVAALAIGPEGGWTEDELASFDQAHWHRASLGPTILRAETAAIAAVTLATALLSS
jgi:16S rRNA (uracil1498-N3)-methyltransferase